MLIQNMSLIPSAHESRSAVSAVIATLSLHDLVDTAGRHVDGFGDPVLRDAQRVEEFGPFTDSETGQVKRVSLYGATAKAARAETKKARERIEAGTSVKDANRSVADRLSHWRVTTLAASGRAASTRALNEMLSRRHLEAAPFGAITLDKLRPSDVEALVLAMRAKTKPGRGENADPVRALSDSTIRQTYTVLRSALDGAVRDGLLARNPAAQVRRPGVEQRDARHLDADDVTAVLKAAEESRYHPALVLIAATGLRKGEALALRWDKVDLDAGVLRVAATISRVTGRLVISEPKTARSRRTVPLSPAVVTMLRKHRAGQAAERLRAANQWQDSVWCSPPGSAGPSILAICSVCLRRRRRRPVSGASVCTRCDTPRRSRGSSGMHIKAVSVLLGHSSIAIPVTYTGTPATTDIPPRPWRHQL